MVVVAMVPGESSSNSLLPAIEQSGLSEVVRMLPPLRLPRGEQSRMTSMTGVGLCLFNVPFHPRPHP